MKIEKVDGVYTVADNQSIHSGYDPAFICGKISHITFDEVRKNVNKEIVRQLSLI